MLSCVYFQNKNRFQAVSRSGVPGPKDTLLRCIQGHSGQIAGQIKSRLAHTQILRAEQCPTLAHYTKTELLPKIIGYNMPGLLPGGRTADEPSQEGRRSHVHMSKQLVSATGVIPEKFRRRDVDCCIRLDSKKLLDDGCELSLSDADVVLADVDLPLPYIELVQLLKWPQLTMYCRPKDTDMAVREDQSVDCSQCGEIHELDTWVCLRCWEPMTIAAIHDREGFLPKTERKA